MADVDVNFPPLVDGRILHQKPETDNDHDAAASSDGVDDDYADDDDDDDHFVLSSITIKALGGGEEAYLHVSFYYRGPVGGDHGVPSTRKGGGVVGEGRVHEGVGGGAGGRVSPRH
jgi:hypothetical protein